MAGKLIQMSKLKQILLLLSQGHSLKGIVRQTGVSRNTIKGYIKTLQDVNMSIDDVLGLEHPEMEHLLSAPVRLEKERKRDFLQRLSMLQSELELPHMTKQLLWEEYKRDNPKGYQYAQFCHYLSLHDKTRKATLPQEHKAGDKIFVDFTGQKMYYVDMSSGARIACEIFIAVLGYSNYMAAVAVHTQKLQDVITATVDALAYIGGSPSAIVPDNLKSAVTASDRYEPIINEVFLDMANYYGMAVLPARARKPKDKAKVERAVTIFYQRILAPLRKQTFYNLHELNTAIREMTTLFNQRKMQQSDYSRAALFERDEHALLRPLPAEPYQIRREVILTVQQNCHVYLSGQKQYYSVPYRLIGLKVHVIITKMLVRIYHQGICVSTHPAQTTAKYCTITEHLPSHHQIILKGMNQASLEQQAASIGAPVLAVIERVFKKSIHPEQAYKSCQGILALSKKTSKEILIQSCEIALQYDACTYRHVQRLALGQYANRNYLLAQSDGKLPTHENLRGGNHYQ